MVYGTPSHGVDSCLEVFPKLNTIYGITILEPGQAYILEKVKGIGIIRTEGVSSAADCVLFGIPEPRKKYLLAENSAGKSGTEAASGTRCADFASGLPRNAASIPYPVLCFITGRWRAARCKTTRPLSAERGLRLRVDDLSDIGADYYALGHIHKPQQVGNLPAYYAGSIYQKDFGETHKAGFNIVTIDCSPSSQRGRARYDGYVRRVDFPHPQNLKIEHRIEGAALPMEGVTVFNEEQVKGKRVWLEITCEKSEISYVNADTYLITMLAYGAVLGSRVTIRDIPIETVRAAEITAVNTEVISLTSASRPRAADNELPAQPTGSPQPGEGHGTYRDESGTGTDITYIRIHPH